MQTDNKDKTTKNNKTFCFLVEKLRGLLPCKANNVVVNLKKYCCDFWMFGHHHARELSANKWIRVNSRDGEFIYFYLFILLKDQVCFQSLG